FGRLQAELITPLIDRGLAILARRGEVPAIRIDGRHVDIDYKSPLARAEARDDVRNTLMWVGAVQKLGPAASDVAEPRAAALWLARPLGVPSELVRHDPLPDLLGLIAPIAEAGK